MEPQLRFTSGISHRHIRMHSILVQLQSPLTAWSSTTYRRTIMSALSSIIRTV